MGLAHQVIVVVVAAEAVPGAIAIRPTATMAVAVTIERVSPRRARPPERNDMDSISEFLLFFEDRLAAGRYW
jgi:hypothetical protein